MCHAHGGSLFKCTFGLFYLLVLEREAPVKPAYPVLSSLTLCSHRRSRRIAMVPNAVLLALPAVALVNFPCALPHPGHVCR